MTDALTHQLETLLNRDTLRQRILELCRIPSPQGYERKAGEYIEHWMTEEGFHPRRVSAVPERFHVIGSIGGYAPAEKKAHDLLIASHLDTEGGLDPKEARWCVSPHATPQEPVAEHDGIFTGAAVSNDRGPMACFLMAGSLIQQAGIKLAGRLHMAACPGEIGPDPIDEREGVAQSGKDVGAAYLLANGGIAPDYMIAAEGTDFAVTAQGAGYAIFRLSLYGEQIFTPLFNSDAPVKNHPNPIYRLGEVIERLHNWAPEFERAHRFETPWGTTIPKVQIGAIRGGLPYSLGGGTGVCALYIEVGLSAIDRVQDVRRALETVIKDSGCYALECVAYRQGAVASEQEVAPLLEAISEATQAVRHTNLEVADPVYASMWRDHNVFNRAGIPAVTFGPRRWRPTLNDFVTTTLLYAQTAIKICGVAA
ncbi:zinc-binding metallopeptidase family protein [Acetobacter thailandicus]|uniref:peptidase M20 n=1 Tax=Acetobacter thailandicus TaxID=1502842 RepID=UPI001BA8AD62|nr:peptidase M20 [Acetobacter thailandicus]MBS0961265.1 peptidase M20 [Acetobacter thailandicus]